ncbi:Scarecrow-like protein 8 [Platanthera guangdongensis]|uniref:Scarecrow-like protein 8 n=1 Tax=Platanthera guangdongensis TaxID=2320717 RepID=A0ABR2LRC7_9ASPA
MLLDTAKAITEGNHEIVAANLAILKKLSNIHDDPDQRLTTMLVATLESRINPPPLENSLPGADVCSADHQTTYHMLYEVSPCFKLGLKAANLAILEDTKTNPKSTSSISTSDRAVSSLPSSTSCLGVVASAPGETPAMFKDHDRLRPQLPP